MSDSQDVAHVGTTGFQEQLIAQILSSLIPANALEQSRNRHNDKKSESRPLNLATLTTNFRKFSSRIGIVFKAQAIFGSIYSWKNPRETTGYGMIWSLICLQPQLVFVLPFVIALFGLLVPSFLQLHPPPPSNIPLPPDLDAWSTNTGQAKEFGGTAEGRDFLLNMRDIQNSMQDYIEAYDRLSKTITDYANFADEKKSSVTLFVCVMGTISSIIVAAYIPVRFIALVVGWIALASGHPHFNIIVARLRNASRRSQEKLIREIGRKVDNEYISPESAPELRHVIVYEYRSEAGEPIYSGFSTIGNAGREDDYVTNNIDSVLAPQGYAFVVDSKWTIEEVQERQSSANLKRTALKRTVVRQL